MRRTYVYDEVLKKLVPKGEETHSDRGPLVIGDLPDILSPIDGKVIRGRAGMRQHNRRHGVTYTEDYKNEWKDKAKERAQFFAGKSSKARQQAVAEAFERVRQGYVPRRVKEGEV